MPNGEMEALSWRALHTSPMAVSTIPTNTSYTVAVLPATDSGRSRGQPASSRAHNVTIVIGDNGAKAIGEGDNAEVLARLRRLPVVDERLVAEQEGDLDAVGTVRAEEIAGRRYWLLDIDRATLRRLDE